MGHGANMDGCRALSVMANALHKTVRRGCCERNARLSTTLLEKSLSMLVESRRVHKIVDCVLSPKDHLQSLCMLSGLGVVDDTHAELKKTSNKEHHASRLSSKKML